MFSKGQKKGTVRFSMKPYQTAKKVSLAGSFNDWKPEAMKKQKDGRFALTVLVPPGSYEYKFVVDDQWLVDPENNTWAINPYGSFNSVAVIE